MNGLMFSEIQNLLKIKQAVLIPGDPEHEAEAIRRKEGIPLIKAVVDDLKDISKQTGIKF
jgi:L-2-hydroxycarboxylate dehydrogenase (NAD+)